MFFISTLALRTTILPSMIYKDIGTESFMLMVGYCFIDLILFFMIYYLLKKNQDISFYKFLSSKIGTFLARVIIISIFAFYFFKILFLISGGFIYARGVIFQEATLSLYVFIILTIAASLYLFKLRSFART
jgi:hypothetical protein